MSLFVDKVKKNQTEMPSNWKLIVMSTYTFNILGKNYLAVKFLSLQLDNLVTDCQWN